MNRPNRKAALLEQDGELPLAWQLKSKGTISISNKEGFVKCQVGQ